MTTGNKTNSQSNQLKTIFLYLKDNVATAEMVAQATGIYHQNICRYKRDLEKSGRLAEVKKAPCNVTGFKAWYITCNESLFPVKPQLGLFDTIETESV